MACGARSGLKLGEVDHMYIIGTKAKWPVEPVQGSKLMHL